MRLSLKTLPLAIFFVMGFSNVSWNAHIGEKSDKKQATTVATTAKKITSNFRALTVIYDSLNLDNLGLSHKAFTYAIQGYERLKDEGKLNNTSVITIVDFDQPSYKKRMYVIDVSNYKVLFNTWSAHGKNTGKEIANSFSNTPESNKSSLGFYVTDDTYFGSKGYSLRLTGIEQNLNDKAFERAIVLHGASYVSQSFINAQGYIGRSHGCPAVSRELNKPIIEKIKNGSMFFIYNKTYKPTKKFQLT